jgi:hypothetical protein
MYNTWWIFPLVLAVTEAASCWIPRVWASILAASLRAFTAARASMSSV